MTKVLNIDEFQPEAPFTVVTKGVEHHMVEPTVQMFLDNLADLEALAAAPTVADEVKMTVKMICRAFPTLSFEDVCLWPLPAIESLFNVVRGLEGDGKVTEQDEEGNGQPAS
ncbi:hypothetical protein HGG70_08100 [Rhodobacteraceae bacterium R_SAG4]|nr:hypothetical protein [Rhodobacteraceae bacterium R_SAG4]